MLKYLNYGINREISTVERIMKIVKKLFELLTQLNEEEHDCAEVGKCKKFCINIKQIKLAAP